MAQPNKRQWRVIWTVAVVLLLFWPLEGARSLAVKAVNFAADPLSNLPVLPPPLPLGLGDNADAVIQYDQQVAEYYDAWDGSAWTRARIRLRDWRDPFDPTTERQALVALAVLGALLVWRLADREGSNEQVDGAA
ncbi:MAG: hypothetical protein PVJ80_07670 [Gemmatimonadota bacterium]|jgi:hypothetical protein